MHGTTDHRMCVRRGATMSAGRPPRAARAGVRRLSSELRGHVRPSVACDRLFASASRRSRLGPRCPGCRAGSGLRRAMRTRASAEARQHAREAHGIKHGMEVRDAMPRPDASRALHPACMMSEVRAEQAVTAEGSKQPPAPQTRASHAHTSHTSEAATHRAWSTRTDSGWQAGNAEHAWAPGRDVGPLGGKLTRCGRRPGSRHCR